MKPATNTLNPTLEIAILRCWAEGATLAQQFSKADIASVPGLAAAVEAAMALPAAIGWDDAEATVRASEPQFIPYVGLTKN